MNRLPVLAYQASAVIAMLAHLVIAGPFTLVGLALIAPAGTEIVALALKALIAVSWVGIGIFGIRAWRDRSWGVVGAPILSFFIVWMLVLIGNVTIGWGLILGP